MRIILTDWSSNQDGVICKDRTGKVMWSIKHEKHNPFTNIFVDQNELKIVKWNGGSYKINIHNAEMKPDEFLK